MHLRMHRSHYLCPECGRRSPGVCLGPHERLRPRAGTLPLDLTWRIIPKLPDVPAETPTPIRASEPTKSIDAPMETLRPAGGKLLRAALAERYPDRVIPRGIAVTLAAEFGISQQRVAQVASSMGWTTAPRFSRKCPPRYECLCGRVQRSPHLCKDCDRVELACGHCNETVRRTAVSMLRFFQYGSSNKVYCNPRCWAADAPRRLIRIDRTDECARSKSASPDTSPNGGLHTIRSSWGGSLRRAWERAAGGGNCRQPRPTPRHAQRPS